MTQPVCPFFNKNQSDKKKEEKSWHKPILIAWLWVALIGSLAWTVLSVTASSIGFLPIELGWTLSIFGQITLFITSLHMYSLRARARFQPTDPRAGSESAAFRRSIPTHGLFTTLFDIVVRKKTLLREIDIERMKKYGDIYLMFAGPLPVIVVTSSSLVEKISKEYDDFSKSDPRDLNMLYYFKWVGNSNVVLANGDQWHRVRRLTHPALNSVHVFSPVFNQKAHFLCQTLREKVASSQEGDGMVIQLSRWLKAVSLDSAGVALFGFDFNHLKEVSNPGIDAMDFVMAEVFDPERIALPIKNHLPLESNRHLEQCRNIWTILC
nr:cytochrome P450 [Pantoea sp. 18069]